MYACNNCHAEFEKAPRQDAYFRKHGLPSIYRVMDASKEDATCDDCWLEMKNHHAYLDAIEAETLLP